MSSKYIVNKQLRFPYREEMQNVEINVSHDEYTGKITDIIVNISVIYRLFLRRVVFALLKSISKKIMYYLSSLRKQHRN